MATIRFGGVAADVRGSINGQVYTRSRAGAVVRNRTNPIQPDTPAQAEQRGFLQQAADQYQALQVSELIQWDNTASKSERVNRLGETYIPSGKQVFTESYVNQLRWFTKDAIGADPAGAIATTAAAADANWNLPGISVSNFNITAAAGILTALEFDYTLTGLGGNTGAVVTQATPALPATWRTGSAVTRYMREIQVDDTPTTIDLLASYIARFGAAAVAGQRIWFRAKAANVTTGFTGGWVYDFFTIP